MRGEGVPMRTLQKWMGHRDVADDAALRRLWRPSLHEALVAAAFRREATAAHGGASGEPGVLAA